MNSSTNPNKATKPLSAYNLFFQYNRIVLLSLDAERPSDFSTSNDIDSPPGLEGLDPNSPILSAPEPEVRKYRKQVIECTINNSPFNDPKKKSYNGSMTFVEMSNYMSKKWKSADETTKNIFRQLSNESKARHQKQHLDSYRKTAKRFSFTNPSDDTSTSKQTPKIVSFGSITPTTEAFFTAKRTAQMKTAMGNATWDEHPSQNQSKISSTTRNAFLQHDVQQSSMSGHRLTSVTANRRSSEVSQHSHIDSRRSSYATSSSAENSSNFHQEIPLDFEMPLPFQGGGHEMSNYELRRWLHNLDWKQM